MAYERILDARNLDPPAPLREALAAADMLGPGEYVRLKIDREPFLLYPLLVSQGFQHACHSNSPSAFEVLIWRSGDNEAESGVHTVLQHKPGA